MRFLLDTDTCSAHMRRPARLAHRFIQHTGQLAISTIALAELFAGAYNAPNPARLLALISDLLQDLTILDFDAVVAEQFGKVRGSLQQNGSTVATADLMIAAVALTHQLVLVTHNTADYRLIPGLILDDWLTP